jgi:hypothetical protein
MDYYDNHTDLARQREELYLVIYIRFINIHEKEPLFPCQLGSSCDQHQTNGEYKPEAAFEASGSERVFVSTLCVAEHLNQS